MVKGKLYPQEFKEKVLKEVSEVGNVSLVARRYSLPVNTLYHWVNAEKTFSKNASSKNFKVLQKELSEKKLEVEILKELLKKTVQVWSKE